MTKVNPFLLVKTLYLVHLYFLKNSKKRILLLGYVMVVSHRGLAQGYLRKKRIGWDLKDDYSLILYITAFWFTNLSAFCLLVPSHQTLHISKRNVTLKGHIYIIQMFG